MTWRFDPKGGDEVKLLAKEATVRTAIIEVRSMMISSKQVTLSVFRQLLKEPLVDPETGELRGVPWGTVNYFWPPCKPNHLHIVWQKGDELRRACEYAPGQKWVECLSDGDDDGTGISVESVHTQPTDPKFQQQWAALNALDQLFIAV